MTHGLINRLAMMADYLIILIGALLTDVRWMGLSAQVSHAQALITGLLASTAFLVVMTTLSAYRVEHYTKPTAFLPSLLTAYVAACLTGLALLGAFKPDLFELHRRWLAGWALSIFALLLAERLILLVLARVVLEGGHLRCRAVIIGATEDAALLARQMTDSGMAHRYNVLGVFDNRAPDRRPNTLAELPVMGTVADLITYAQHHPVDMVIIALPWENAIAIFRLIEEVQWIAADVVVPFETQGFQPGTGQLIDVAGHPAMQMMTRPFKGTQGLLKLMEDYVIATIGIVLASPVMALAALAILIEDGRPILFRQERMGFNGRTFKIYKFRTMQIDPTDTGAQGTDKGDPRITRIGRFLRSTSIDEIPQLLNVLRGEMSIVGPRPHVQGMLVGSAVYTEAVRRYAARHRIKPGITGWAQINGMRGGIHTLVKAEKGVQLDLYYVRHWSLWLDIKIMLRTLLIGMVGRDVF
jgi:exopolysaccharide biosynthesis polyprenyl glycosylphosphotransferase